MRVLYVCTGNSFRSPVAEALTRRYRPEFDVESAGTDAADIVSPVGEKLLKLVNADGFLKPEPDQLAQRAIDDADRVIAMRKEHRDFIDQNFDAPEHIEVWNVKDPVKPGVMAPVQFLKLRRKVRDLEQ